MRSDFQSRVSAGIVGVVLTSFSSLVGATTLEDLNLPPDLVDRIAPRLYSPSAAPATAFGSPIGFGTGYGEFYVGVGGKTLPETAEDSVDGSIGLGAGIGDPFKWVALEVSSSIISVTDEFGHDGNFNLKLHHALANKLGVAIGVMNTGRWGDAKRTTSSTYVALTRPFDISSASSAMPITLTLNGGLGEGRFGTAQFNTNGGYEGLDGFGGFASVGLTLARRFSVIADYTGSDLNAGISIVPFRDWALVITAGVINITEHYSEYGVDRQFAGGFSYTFRL